VALRPRARPVSQGGFRRGLKLEAAYTELVFWKRVGHEGEAGTPRTVVDWLPLLSEYIATSDAVCYAVAAADSTIQACSAGMAAALDAGAEDLIGKSLFDFLAEHSRETVMNDVAAGRRLFRESSLLNLSAPGANASRSSAGSTCSPIPSRSWDALPGAGRSPT
jgi:hypothetical protein